MGDWLGRRVSLWVMAMMHMFGTKMRRFPKRKSDRPIGKVVQFATLALLSPTVVAAQSQGEVSERIETYSIHGKTGLELYRSIGERGPQVGGGGRAIAHTNFALTWNRQYVPQGNSCTLKAARARLVITYTLPKPAGPLPAATQQRWDTFIDGIHRHELVHGDMIKEMLETIKATTVGLTVPDDPKCTRIREEIKVPLSAASQAQRQKSRDFDRVEMGDGGNVRRLILNLVNE